MIIGVSLGALKGLTLKGAMEVYSVLSKDFDLSAVEIRFEKEEGRPSVWAWENNNNLAHFLTQFEISGAHLPFVYLNPISPNPRIKRESLYQLKTALDKASELGMNYAVMHARGSAGGLAKVEQLKEWKEVISELAEYAEGSSIMLTLENADFLSNLADLVNIVREIDSDWLKITLDVGHAYNRCLAPLSTYPVVGLTLKMLDRTFFSFSSHKYMPYEEYGSLKNFFQSEHDLIYNLHIHDNDGRRDHLSLGQGKIDFSFLSTLNEIIGPLILEVEFENHRQDFEKNYRKLRSLLKGR